MLVALAHLEVLAGDLEPAGRPHRLIEPGLREEADVGAVEKTRWRHVESPEEQLDAQVHMGHIRDAHDERRPPLFTREAMEHPEHLVGIRQVLERIEHQDGGHRAATQRPGHLGQQFLGPAEVPDEYLHPPAHQVLDAGGFGVDTEVLQAELTDRFGDGPEPAPEVDDHPSRDRHVLGHQCHRVGVGGSLAECEVIPERVISHGN